MSVHFARTEKVKAMQRTESMQPHRGLICLAEALHERWLSVEAFAAEVYKGHLKAVSQDHFASVAHDEFRLKLPREVVPVIFENHADADGKLARSTFELELAACTRLLREQAPDAAPDATKHRATVGSMRKAMSVRFGSVEHDPHEYNGLLAVVAHNNTKPLMKRFIEDNLDVISLFPIVTTRSTGTVLEEAFGLAIDTKVSSGPLGGDQEIGGMISKGEVDGVLFFRDPLSAHPHVDDINALMRICDVHCVATANNPVSGRAVLLWLSQLSQARKNDLAAGKPIATLLEERKSGHDSEVVIKYKSDQTKVIKATVAGSKGPDRPSSSPRHAASSPRKRPALGLAHQDSEITLDFAPAAEATSVRTPTERAAKARGGNFFFGPKKSFRNLLFPSKRKD